MRRDPSANRFKRRHWSVNAALLRGAVVFAPFPMSFRGLIILPRAPPFAAPEIRLGGCSECGTEYFIECAYAAITDRDRHIGYRHSLREHFERSEQSCVLPPTAKRHAHFTGKSAHERAPG